MRERAAKPRRAENRLTGAVFGLGNLAKATLIPCVERHMSVECVHEIDPTQLGKPDKLRWTADTSPVIRDDEQHDVYFIAGYHHTHAHLTAAAPGKGARVVSEKPLVTTEEEFQTLMEAVRQHPGRLYACFQMRYGPLWSCARRDLGVAASVPAGRFRRCNDHETCSPKERTSRLLARLAQRRKSVTLRVKPRPGDETRLMKQVLQHIRTGEIEVPDVPCPLVRPGHLLIQSRATLISAGTERSLVEFSKGSLLAKARSQPDKVKQVLNRIKTDGLVPTLEMVFARLDEPFPLGYCNAGVVVEVGQSVEGFEVGDRVVSNGPHAEVVCVPQNLCAKIPDKVSDEAAAFAVLGAIGLQGIRLLTPTIGEAVVVTGLGLIGLMTVQMLRANGCRVLGIDPNPARSELARRMGAETADLSAGADPVASAAAFSHGRGVDGVIITASAKTNEIVKQSAQMCRQRGRIILVGVVGLELSRADFYQKELTFQVSCSYGPGRYDSSYEEGGQDYPLGFVRWTEQRNFDTALQLMASGQLEPVPLISERIEQSRAVEAYRVLTDNREALGIILSYPGEQPPRAHTVTLPASAKPSVATGQAVVGVIGAGNFARMTGLPALAKTDARFACIADLNGAAGAHVGKKFGFERTTTDYHTLLDDPDINTVFIFTRHDLHAPLVMQALEAGKHTFVEKPLCLNSEELARVRRTYQEAQGRQLLVGFNRRFSPHGVKMKSLLATRTQPLCMSMMVNAGVIPADSWTQDPRVGGGRIVGEGCHWIDLMAFLAGAPVTRVVGGRVGESPGMVVRDDKATITLHFADGSMGTLHYFGNGHKSYPKETMEVYCDGKVLRLDNFRVLRAYGWPGFRKMRVRRIDKGHYNEFNQFVAAVASGGPMVMPFEQIENVTRAALAAVESAATGTPIDLE